MIFKQQLDGTTFHRKPSGFAAGFATYEYDPGALSGTGIDEPKRNSQPSRDGVIIA